MEQITPLSHQLYFLAKYKVLVMTFKALNGLRPGYLKDCLHCQSGHIIISNLKTLLKCLPVKTIRLVSTQNKAFSVAAPQLENLIPSEIRLTLLTLRSTFSSRLLGANLGYWILFFRAKGLIADGAKLMQ